MKNKRKFPIKTLTAFLVLWLVVSCRDESKGPILTFESATKGAYIRLLGKSGAEFFNILTPDDFNNSVFTYSVEFIDGAGGSRVTEYKLTVEYVDNDDSNGDDSFGPATFLVVPASQFVNGPNGNKALLNINISAADIATFVGTTYADIRPGDLFRFKGEVAVGNMRFNSDNSSSTVEGSAFQGFFDFGILATCPSNLAGTYSYTASNYWCPEWTGGSIDGTVEIIALGGGNYTFSDWSFGAYPACYGGQAAGWGTLKFTDVCAKVSFTGFTDNYGDTWTFVSSISGNDWIIQWSNTYGESGQAAIHFPGGVPFTLN
jgi:hypothetical protein